MSFFIPHPPVDYHAHRTSSSSSIPRRKDSLRTETPRPVAETLSLNKVLASADDDLRDARRAGTHGQEEDLKYALNRLISRVEEMSSILKSAYKYQSELETSLTLAKSNLKMAQANTELMEDTLRRDVARRSLQEPRTPSSAGPSPNPGSYSPVPETPASSATPDTPAHSAVPHAPSHGLFGFKLPGSRHPSPPGDPKSPPALAAVRGVNHAASASMPSLVAEPALKRVEELNKVLEEERKATKKAKQEKSDLEDELESLSQALFEEANKMVASERIKAGDLREELQELRRQKDALASALRLVEDENTVLRRAKSSVGGLPSPSLPSSPNVPSSLNEALSDTSFSAELRRLHRTSSEIALKSPGPRPPRSPARLRTPSFASSRPGTPLQPSPLSFSRSISHSPPASPVSASAPAGSMLGGAMHAEPGDATSSSRPSGSRSSSSQWNDATPPAIERRFTAPQFSFQDATPPAVTPTATTPFAGPPRMAFPDVPASAGAIAAPPKRPGPVRRRSTFSAPPADVYDPNHPTTETEHSPDSAPQGPLFPRPNLSALGARVSGLGKNLPSLEGLRAVAMSLPGSPISSPRESPFFTGAIAPASSSPGGESPEIARGSAGVSPISIPRGGSVHAMPAEESPWADSPVLGPALTRMSSVGSAAGERMAIGLGRAREALSAGIAGAFDFEEVTPVRARSPGEVAGKSPSPGAVWKARPASPARMGSYEAAAFGVRMG